MKKVLITGAAGFIGSKLARYLNSEGFSIIGVDNFSLGKRENLPPEIPMVEADVSDPREIREKFSGFSFDVIIHLAGQSGGELSFSETMFDLDSNVRSTVALLQFAKEKGVDRFVHASSVAVYGNQPHSEKGLREDDPKLPKSPYGVSKLAAEGYLEVLSEAFGISSTSLRFFNVYGPGQDFDRMNQGMLSIYLAQALRGGKVLVKGSSYRYRDFVHVDDAVESCRRAMDLKHLGHVSLNVCTGEKTYVWQALEIIRDMFGEKIRFEFSDATPGDVEGWVGDTGNLVEKLSWRPDRVFEQGFRQMVKDEMRGAV